MTTIRYYNGYDYGYFETDLLDLVEYGTQSQCCKFFRHVLKFADDRLQIVADLSAEIFDRLSELRTLLDIMTACAGTTKTDINRTKTKIKRLEKAEKLCQEVK